MGSSHLLRSEALHRSGHEAIHGLLLSQHLLKRHTGLEERRLWLASMGSRLLLLLHLSGQELRRIHSSQAIKAERHHVLHDARVDPTLHLSGRSERGG
jgi:hypothetical protein